MVRLFIFIAFVGLCALGFAWVADRPGAVAVTWQGYQLETSVTVGVVALVVFAALAILVWSFSRGLITLPRRLREAMQRNRDMRGQLALTRGLIAVGAGDASAARRFADEAKRLSHNQPLTLLLGAQAAQLTGDREAAADAFRAMAARDDTKLLGLRGLYIEAQRREDHATARLFAEEASRTDPALQWAGRAVLEFRGADGDWDGALDALKANAGSFGKAEYARKRAVLLTARALAQEDTDPSAARDDALGAVKLAPDLVPAAALAGRLLSQSGDVRRAAKIVEAAWKRTPHPDLADAYANLRFGDSALDRLTRVRKLLAKSPGGVEGSLALARSAIDGRDFGLARQTLEPFLSQPTRRIALVMSQIERLEHGDEGRARAWLARAGNAAPDPAWTADGIVSRQWLPVSPATGKLDAFVWKVPLAELAGPEGAAREDESPPVIDMPPRPVAPAADNDPAEGISAAPKPSGNPEPGTFRRSAEPVIPLIHAPDDPGTEPDPELDSTPRQQDWQRLRPF